LPDAIQGEPINHLLSGRLCAERQTRTLGIRILSGFHEGRSKPSNNPAGQNLFHRVRDQELWMPELFVNQPMKRDDAGDVKAGF